MAGTPAGIGPGPPLLQAAQRHAVKIPPIKTQGIKSRRVPFIMDSISWTGGGRWMEPFLGSGVVMFNASPRAAVASDLNPHIIGVYRGIQAGRIRPAAVREFLEREGRRLLASGGQHHYEVRDRFNRDGEPLDFLFLNRACFNGIVRFNSRGGFNTPFGRKPGRFSKAYVTKIANQVGWLRGLFRFHARECSSGAAGKPVPWRAS